MADNRHDSYLVTGFRQFKPLLEEQTAETPKIVQDTAAVAQVLIEPFQLVLHQAERLKMTFRLRFGYGYVVLNFFSGFPYGFGQQAHVIVGAFDAIKGGL
jgi:hypothetical protein